MSDTNTPSPAPIASPSLIFWRISWPFFLFSLALAILFSLSWLFLLPRYTRVDIGGKSFTGAAIRDEKVALTADIASMEDQRRKLVLAIHDPHYDALKEHRRERRPINEFTTTVEEHAKTITGGTVHFQSFAYDPENNSLVVTGDIRDAGVSSMTVLAEYISSLKLLPEIATATTPTFSREEDPKIGLFSPFHITLTFK